MNQVAATFSLEGEPFVLMGDINADIGDGALITNPPKTE